MSVVKSISAIFAPKFSPLTLTDNDEILRRPKTRLNKQICLCTAAAAEAAVEVAARFD